jgi:methylthioribose-1-phosphate isomerase
LPAKEINSSSAVSSNCCCDSSDNLNFSCGHARGYSVRMLKTLEWTGQALRLLDQTRLPNETVYLEITDEQQLHDAIRRLVVRGAPAIGVAAAFGVYLGVRDFSGDTARLLWRVNEVCEFLATSRPTAVNLFWALKRVQRAVLSVSGDDVASEQMKQRILDECLAMLDEDKRVCRAIGEHGLEYLRKLQSSGAFNILTHCNAGSLATVAYGTALAPIYLGVERGLRFHVYADETRPLLQGSRLTAFELRTHNVPVTVLCDNMAASVMSEKKVDVVIVGADRIAANGDVANKIGTLGVAVLARHFKIPFLVAAPTSTIDLSLSRGDQIPIEQRDPREISHGFGAATAPRDVDFFNPAFDVTPAELIDAIITECGVVTASYDESLRAICTS